MHIPLKFLSLTRKFSTKNTSIQWRIQIKQNQLVSQISTILLQRHDSLTLLQNLNLSSKLTPSLILQILHKTHTRPQISLDFFNWSKTNLRFQPDLKSQCHIIQLCVHAGLEKPAKPILDSLIQNYASSLVINSMIQACDGKDSVFNALNFLLECYSSKGLFKEALEVFKKMRDVGCVVSASASHSLLDLLVRENQVKFAWCVFGAMIRGGFLLDKFSWSLVVEILCKEEKIDRIEKLLDIGICNSAMYNAVVDYYSRIGDFDAVFDRLNEMCTRELNAGFSTYSSILDGACKHGNDEIADQTIAIMVEKGLLKESLLLDGDSIIQKLCSSGKLNASLMFFRRACNEKICLQDATYENMLKAFSKDGRLDEAIDLYHLVKDKRIQIKDNTSTTFVNLVCEQGESAEGFKILKETISGGIKPRMTSLSKFIATQCHKQRWNEVEELLNMVLNKGLLPNSSCFSSLIRHYCQSRQMNKSLELHDKMEMLQVSLDAATYNILVDALVREGRVDEAVELFDYVKEIKSATSESFTAVIRALCGAKEARKAMKLHDQMLEMGLKPEKAIYKSLILEFDNY